MPYFLFTATTVEGKVITDRIYSNSLTQARSQLERDGHTSIIFFDDEFTGELQQAIGPDYSQVPQYTPEMHLDGYKNSGIQYSFLYILKLTKRFSIPLLIWVLVSI
ncbi:MAG: hypothetical protein AB1489_43730, partial [Acidobacteriota bacterium]